MKHLPLRRLLPALFAAAAALLAGCSTGQHSTSTVPVAPNWYDSAYYKDGSLVTPNPPWTTPTAGPLGQ